MNDKVRMIKLGVLPLLLSGILGCDQLMNLGLPSLNIVAIGELPQQTQTQETVQVKGQVKKTVPFLGKGAYQLEDETGVIWVLTQEALPQIGDEVIIEGNLEYQNIPIGEQDLGEFYVIEVKKISTEAQSSLSKNSEFRI